MKPFCILACLLPLAAGGFGMAVWNDQTHYRVGGQFGVLQSIQYSTTFAAPVVSTFICLGEVAVSAPWVTGQPNDRETTALRQLWATNYCTNSVPAAWTPARIASSTTDRSAFERFTPTISELTISNFIARFGWPSRYLVGKWRNGQVYRLLGGLPIRGEARSEEVPDFLIYDLPDGSSVALYVSKPPNDRFEAAVIIDPGGQLLKWIR